MATTLNINRFLICLAVILQLATNQSFCRPLTTVPVIDCSGATVNGTIAYDVEVSTAYFVVPYSSGGTGSYSGEVVNSTGVTGLTASRAAGTFSGESCQLVYNITGTPTSYGTAYFEISLGGSSCTISATVVPSAFRAGTVHCSGTPTAIVDVTNPQTGKIWMDRNLGATQVATSKDNAAAYGDLYQWGRGADGHQCRNSATTLTRSVGDQPGHGDFIKGGYSNWRTTSNNNLWQGVSGVNNPCPSGYRIPTEAEWLAERSKWSSNNSDGAFSSPLKLTVSGSRSHIDGSLSAGGNNGFYWSSTVNGARSQIIFILSFTSATTDELRAKGQSVRCIKN